MKTEIIPNQYDGPRRPEKKLVGGYFSLDCANSDDATEIDQGCLEGGYCGGQTSPGSPGGNSSGTAL